MGTAAELVADHPLERIRTMIELHDWHNARGLERGPGFIVAGIRSKEPYSLPRGFRPSRPAHEKTRIRPIREKTKQADPRSVARQKSELEPFLAFWDKLDAKAQSDFEQ